MKILTKMIGLSILLILIYFAASWYISAKEIITLCNGISESQSISSINNQIRDSWFLKKRNIERDKKNYILVHSPSNFGRHTCTIEYENEKVISKSYRFLD